MWALRKKECHQYLMTKINYFLLWNRGREVKNSCGKLRTMLLILKIKKRLKNFLKVQWLRLCLPMKGVQVWSLVRKIIEEGNGTPLKYSCLENPMDRGAWWAAVHGVARSQTRLSDFIFTFHFHALEKEMATHSSDLAWRIPGMGSLVGCHLWGRTEPDMTEAA